MRIGLMLNEPGPGPDPVGELTSTVRTASADGFESVWMPHLLGLDALTALAIVGREVPDIELATGVVPIYFRHPVSLAQSALTTQAAIAGRLTLGVGLSHQVIVESMFGLSFDRPLRYMTEYLSILQPLLDERSVTFKGETMKTRIAVSTPCAHRVPVMLAALGPKMLKLAGERTDGTVLAWTGPATLRTHIVPTITSAAAEAGRPPPRIVCTLPVCVTEDVGAARDKASEMFAIYGQLPSYRAMLDHEGATAPGDLAVVGTDDGVRAQIETFADIGVTDFVAAEFGSATELERTRTLLRSLSPVAVTA